MPFGPILRAMSHNKTRFALIILEIAITLAIVSNCVNMILDQRQQMQRRSGFDDENLVWVRSRPFDAAFRDRQYLLNSAEADMRTIAGIPGVRAVASTNFIPWQGGGSSGTMTVAGATEKGKLQTQQYFGSIGIFDTLGVRISEGRAFTPNDFNYDTTNGNPTVVVVSRAFARLAFGDASPIGRQIVDPGPTTYTIVGVFDEFYNPYGWPIHEYAVFFPGPVGSYGRGTRYLVRVQPGAMRSVVPEIDRRLSASNRGRVMEERTILEIKDNFFTNGRIVTKAMTAVIVVLIFITALGIVGLTSLSVTERTKQIGTRRALGATRGDILRQFLLENWIVTSLGLLLGVVAAYGLNFLLVSHVSGVKMDPRLIVAGMLLLWVNGLVATVLPALRASGVSPAIATRSV